MAYKIDIGSMLYINYKSKHALILRFSIILFLYFIITFAILELAGFGRVKIHIKFFVIAFSWILMLFGILQYRLINSTGFSLFDKFFLCIYLFWCVVSIARSIVVPLENISALPRFLGDPLFTAALLVPFFVLYGCRIEAWREIWRLALPFVRVFLMLSPLLFIFSKQYIHISFFIPLLILNWDWLETKDKIITSLSFLIVCAYAISNSERNLFVHFAYFPFAFYFIVLFNKVSDKLNKIIRMSAVISIVFMFWAFLYSGHISPYISDPDIKKSVKEYEAENFNSTTHNLVFEDFFHDFSKSGDWIFGRGGLGYTFSEQFITIQEMTETEKNVFNLPIGYRTEVECGYLMMILKSGVLGLSLFLIIALRAIFLGLFFSKSIFIKGFSFIIIEWLIIMYPFGWPEYTISYILVWLCIGACLSSKVRNLTDRDIYILVAKQR